MGKLVIDHLYQFEMEGEKEEFHQKGGKKEWKQKMKREGLVEEFVLVFLLHQYLQSH